MGRQGRGWLLVGVQVVMFVVLLLLPWRTPTWTLVVLGGLIALAGVLVLLAAMRSLGRALTPTPVPIPGAGLRTSGVYGVVRHPIYSGLLLAVLGLLVALGSAASWIWGLAMLLFFWTKSRWEDRLLHEEYGQQWEAWARTTGRLVPRLTGRAGHRDGGQSSSMP